ncbi:MAG: endonuclease/exonuclease/phosphatase family protein [Armatimonadota bacterium]
MRKDTRNTANHPAPRLHWARRLFLILSGLLLGFLSVCYIVRPDVCAAVTVLPAWGWLPLGWGVSGLGWAPRRGRPAFALLLVWLVVLAALSDEPRVLLHPQAWRHARLATTPAQGTLRIITYNCNGYGDAAKSAAQVVQYHPDLVLLQEVPQDTVMVNLGRQLFGKDAAVFTFCDTAILARGKILRADRPRWGKDLFYTQARVRFTSGLEVEVFCLHLLPTNTQMDLWNRECWEYRLDIRREQRAQVERLLLRMNKVSADTPVILGGDFNAPAGDAIFRLLQPRLHDLYAEGGVGWGNTFPSELPALRIDALWASRHFRARAAWARATPDSDHRMVICDLGENTEVRIQNPEGKTHGIR